MYIHKAFAQNNHTTPLHSTIQNILLAVNPSHCFSVQKASGPGRSLISLIIMNYTVHVAAHCSSALSLFWKSFNIRRPEAFCAH